MTRQGRRLRSGAALKAAAAGLPHVWTGAWGALLLATAVWIAQPVVAQPFVWAWMGAALLSATILVGAVSRIAIADAPAQAKASGLGPAGLQFGRAELHLLGAAALCGVFLAMILSVAALVLLAVFGIADLNAQAIRARAWGAVGPWWKLAVLGLITSATAYAIVVLVTRLSLFAPATVGRGRMISLEGVGLTRGVTWPLFAGLALVSAPVGIVLALLASGFLAGPLGWIVFASAAAIVQTPLTIGYLGAAYRQVEELTAAGGRA